MAGVWQNRVGYPVVVSRSRDLRSNHGLLRRAARLLALLPAVALAFTASSAVADAPDTWPTAPSVSGVSNLVVLVLVPAALFAVITLLVYLPSMSRRNNGYQPGQPWRHEPQWFGGPRQGVDALEAGSASGSAAGQAEHADQDGPGAGGTSARW